MEKGVISLCMRALDHDPLLLSSLYLDAHHVPVVPLQVEPEFFHFCVDDLLHARLAEAELAQRRQHEAVLGWKLWALSSV